MGRINFIDEEDIWQRPNGIGVADDQNQDEDEEDDEDDDDDCGDHEENNDDEDDDNDDDDDDEDSHDSDDDDDDDDHDHDDHEYDDDDDDEVPAYGDDDHQRYNDGLDRNQRKRINRNKIGDDSKTRLVCQPIPIKPKLSLFKEWITFGCCPPETDNNNNNKNNNKEKQRRGRPEVRRQRSMIGTSSKFVAQNLTFDPPRFQASFSLDTGRKWRKAIPCVSWAYTGLSPQEARAWGQPVF